jgi:uncharacterized protein YndB with AHSA1/START domain
MNQQTSETAIRKTVTVACPAGQAFRLYTDQLASWWPYTTHSVEEENVETVVFEGREGGRFYERAKSGEEHTWGTVLVWDPPSRIVHSWHPGRGEETSQEVEVTFTPEENGTRVDLVHTGWTRLGDRMETTMANYQTGWDLVLGRYVEAAGRRR